MHATICWTSQDPLLQDYYPFSPYAFCANNPISRVDPNGMADTDYRNEKGELLHRTKDGLNDAIIVSEGDIPELTRRLDSAYDNETSNDPEINRETLHTLGKTPEQYTEDAFKGATGDEWTMGYKTTYKRGYEGKTSWGPKTAAFVLVVAGGGESGPMQHQSGMSVGSYEGKRDRKEGKVNRLNPVSSFKNNEPLIKLPVNKSPINRYAGVGLPPK